MEETSSLSSTQLPKSEWDFHCSDDQVTISIITSLDQEYTLRLRNGSEDKDMNSAIVNEKNTKVTLWWMEMPRAFLKNRQVRLTILVGKKGCWESNYDSEEIPEVVNSYRYDHLFYFSLSFPRLSQTKVSPTLEFLYFFEYAVSCPTYKSIIPQLVLQYNSYRNKNVVERSIVYECVDRVCQRQEDSLSIAFVGCVFAMFGSITYSQNPQREPNQKTANALLSYVNPTFMRQLESCSIQEFVFAVQMGLARYVFPGTGLPEEAKENAIIQLLQCGKLTRDALSQLLNGIEKFENKHIDLWIEVVKKNEDANFLVKILLEKVGDYPAFFKIVNNFDSFQLKDMNFLQNALGKLKYRGNYGNENQPNVNEIEEVLDILSAGSEIVRRLFYSTSLPGLIKQTLENPSPAHLSIYKRLFVTQCDYELVGAVDKKQFLMKLCEKQQVSFAEVVNELKPEEKDIEAIFQQWMKAYCTWHYYDRKNKKINCPTSCIVINKSNEELQQLTNTSLLPVLTAKAIELFWQKFPLSSSFLKAIAMSIDSLTTEQLKLAYISHHSVLSHLGSDKSQVSVQDLLREKASGPQSWTIDKLLEYSFKKSPMLTYEAVESKLIEMQGNEEAWIMLMRDYHQYNTIEPVTNLRSLIQQFANNVKNRHLSIRKFLHLRDKKNDAELQGISQLMSYAMEMEHQADQTLQEAFKAAKEISAKFELLQQFLKNIVFNSEEHTRMLEESKNFQAIYIEMLLDEFTFPPSLEALLAVANATSQFVDSRLFLAEIEKVKKVKPITMENIQAICLNAIGVVLANVNSLLNSLKSKKVAEVLTVFAPDEDFQKEIDLLMIAQPEWKGKLMELSEGLHYYQNREKIQKNCKHLHKLQLSEATAVDSAQRYKNERVEEMEFGAMMQTHKAITAALYPEGDCKNSEVSFDVWAELQDSDELTNFLRGLSEERLKHLLECVNDHDESTVTVQLILKLETVWHFFQEVQNQRSCSTLLALISEKLQTPKFENIKKDIQECSNNIRAVMELNDEQMKKEETKKKQIDAICKSSKLSFSKKNDNYAVSLRCSGIQKTCFDISELQELKDRASLTLHATYSLRDDSSQILSTFVAFVNVTQRTAEMLINLYECGFPVDIAERKEFNFVNGNFQELEEFQKRATTQLQEWTNCIEDAYLNCFPLTFLFGRQFWTLEEHLYGKCSNEAANLLAYMHRRTGEILQFENVPEPPEQLRRLCGILNRLQIAETSQMQINYEAPVKAKINSPPGSVLYIPVAEDRVLNALVSAFLNSGRPFPQAHQVMHCTHRSQWVELQAFLYRCFTSPQEEMFALIGPERLPLEIQTAVRTLCAKMVIRKRTSSLVVITTEESSLLAEYFQLLEEPRCIRTRSEQILSEEHVLSQLISQINTKVCTSSTIVVYSETAGMGKSTWVQEQAKSQRILLQKFPIAGDLDLEVVCRQLLEAVKPECMLLLILSHVDNPEVLNDLLTCICLLRTVKAGNLVITFPPTCRVYIEVQNLQPALQLPFLNYLKKEVIRFDTNHFILTEESKKVAAYLHLYETNALENGNVTAVAVTKEMTINYLIKYFIEPQTKKGQPVSFLAVRSFINVIFALLTGMENSPFTSAMIQVMIEDVKQADVPQLAIEYKNLRTNIVSSFLQTCEEVTTCCVAQVRTAQRQALGGIAEVPSFECTLKWDDSNHFSMIFLTDGSNVAIYRKPEHVPDSLKKLIYLQSNCHRIDGPTLAKKIKNKEFQIPDYTNLTHIQALQYLQTYVKANINLAEKHSDSSYVLTQDNFLKMNLIYLRAISRLPIIIMGETGCGKTSLIRFFVKEVLREPLDIVNIHAGITSKILAQRVSELRNKATENSSTRLWVFFDEFNTSDCVGQICEMLCEGTFRGEELPRNIVWLAACNPYRLRPEKLLEDSVGIKKSDKYRIHMNQNLMHVVKPLPESVIEFIWDFGALTVNDSRKYIGAMLKQIKCEKYESLFAGLVFESQKFFQELEDFSSVSLRDVARFVIFYEWFEKSLKTRKAMRENERFNKNCRRHQLQSDWSVLNDEKYCAGVLALCNCYYYRLAKQEQKQVYLERVCSQANGQLTRERIEKIMKCNEDDFIARMELPSTIAVNQAFRENLSCLLHCIFCKIALFICGKPGCSKSLAVQLVFSNLRGKKSVDPYFCTLPQLVMVSFQGSESCTSEGIEKVFDRAKKFLSSEQVDLLPVVVFDEIGLAELSRHNPLKVLHGLLELENRSVGFVGVSNWRLDASKMNRAMYLAHPDPDCNQLRLTAESIFTACSDKKATKDQLELIVALANAYYQYKEELKGTRDADFFGLRDFYSMIKLTSSKLSSENPSNLESTFRIVKYSIERNFGGKVGAASRILKIITTLIPEFQHFDHFPPTSTIELINGNLKDLSARFLMLICKGDVATNAVDRFIELPQIERRTLVGSHMREDEGGEEYAFRSLSDIILYMEKGILITLKDMDLVHTSLYDLYNQNFAESGDRKYCRVALGAQFNPRCFVHNDFGVIVFMSDDDEILEQTDAPFLNRFEKHRFDIDETFTPRHVDAFRQLEDWTGSLMKLASGRIPLISLSHVFPLYTPEYLKLMVLYHDSEGSIVNKCKQELLKMASQDVVLLAHAGDMEPQERASIQETWIQYHRDPFLTYLSSFSQISGSENSDKSLVFLYNTDILTSGQLSQLPVSTNYQQFSSFRKEQEVMEDIMNFYRGPNQLYILDFNLSKDGAHLVMIKFIVEKFSKEMKNSQKKVCLLVRLMRNVPINIEVCWFGQWDIRTFTSCREPDFVFSNEVVVQSIEEVVRNHPFYNFEAALRKLTIEAYQTFAFQKGKNEENWDLINEHIFSMSEQVTTNPHLVAAMRDKLLSLLPKTRWLDDVLCRSECVTRASNIPTAIRCAVELNLAAVYPKVLYEIERYGAFPSFFVETPEHEVLQRLWFGVFNTLKCDIKLQLTKQSNRMEFGPMPKFPFIRKEYEMLQKESQKQPDDQAENQFLRKYAEISILKEVFAEVNNSRALQDLYFSDLIRLDLETQTSALKEDLFMLLHRCWSCDQPTFEGKVWMYAQNRLFGSAICEIVDILQTLKLETKAINDQLTEFSTHYEQVEDAAEDSAAAALRSMLKVELQKLITSISTSSKWIQYTNNPREAALLLSKLFNSIDCLDYVHGFFLENYDEIDILALCFQVLSRTPQAEHSLRLLQQSIEGVTDGPFLYNDAFSKQLFSIIKTSCSDDYSQHVLFSYLFKLLINNEVESLPMIAEQLDSEEWQQVKCCSSLVVKITSIAKLTSTEEWSIVMEIERSSFVEELERILQVESASTRFAVLLCDAVYWHLKTGLHFKDAEEAAAIVSQYYDNFKQFCRLLIDPHIAFPWITKVYCSAFLRCFLEAYCKVVHDEIQLPPDSKVQQVSEELDAEWLPTARAYVLKYWKYSEKLSIPKLQLILRQRSLLKWTSHFTFPEQYNEPVPCSKSPYYQRVSQLTAAVLIGEQVEPLSDVVKAADNVENKVEFATAVMMNAYLRLAEGKENSALEYALQTAAGLIQEKFGKAMSNLINCFINNFPEGSCLRLSAKTSEGDTCRALVLCFALITLSANANSGSPLTCLFLDKEGNIRADVITIVKGSYVCGVGCHPMYAGLQYLRDNFETLKSTTFFQPYSKGSANKCSCGYVYIIDKCGGPTEIRPCPFCGQDIGGTSHKLVERPGHENMTDQDAVKFLEKSLAQYKRAPETGYWSFDADEQRSQPLRGMAPLAHAALHLLTALFLRFLNMCNLLSNTDLQKLVQSIQPLESPSAHLEEQILKDFASIKTMLNTDDSHLWWYAMLRQFSVFMQSHRDLPCDLATRTRVEAKFNDFLQPFSRSSLEIVQREKKTATSSGIDALQLLNETNLEEQLRTFPLLHLFRLVRTPDVDSLSGALNLLQLGEQYPLVKLYVQMREDVAKLSMFSPLIEFINYMKNQFDYKIRREEARVKRFVDATRSDPEAERLFRNCSDVWSWLECSSVAYECHQLPPKRFSSSDELIYFLIDKQEKGGGMYMAAALLKLAEIQNTVMSGFLAAMEKKLKLSGDQIIDLKKIPIQTLKPENAVKFALKTLEDFSGLFLNNTEYGKGKEVVFNFPRIEEAIQTSFQKGRFLAVDSLEFICYTYELLSISSNHSDLITRIRSSISQLAIDSVLTGRLERFLAKKEGDDETHRQNLDNYYQSLSSMLCFLRNPPAKQDMTLQEFAQTVNKFEVCKVYTTQTPLSEVKIAQVVALYELLEQQLFPYSKQFVKNEFKKTSEEVTAKLRGLNLPKTHCSDLQLAVIRLILRLLIADIDPTHAMALYLVRPDLWAGNYEEEQRDNIVGELGDLPLAHAVQVHDFLEKKLKEGQAVVAKPPPKPAAARKATSRR